MIVFGSEFILQSLFWSSLMDPNSSASPSLGKFSENSKPPFEIRFSDFAAQNSCSRCPFYGRLLVTRISLFSYISFWKLEHTSLIQNWLSLLIVLWIYLFFAFLNNSTSNLIIYLMHYPLLKNLIFLKKKNHFGILGCLNYGRGPISLLPEM